MCSIGWVKSTKKDLSRLARTPKMDPLKDSRSDISTTMYFAGAVLQGTHLPAHENTQSRSLVGSWVFSPDRQFSMPSIDVVPSFPMKFPKNRVEKQNPTDSKMVTINLFHSVVAVFLKLLRFLF